jgi:exosortase K
MNQRIICKRNAQLAVVLLCAAAVKLFYSTASVNQLRWILAPTTFLVELAGGSRFEFESHAGYVASDHSFVIAASCAGVNFLITAFLMLSLGKLWRDRSQTRSQDRTHDAPQNLAWRFIPVAAVVAYLATLVANTVRISTALRLHRMPLETSWLSGNQLHRVEGIFIYFGFLLLLFLVSEKMEGRAGSGPESRSGQPAWGGGCDRVLSLSSENPSGPARRSSLLRQSFFPLLIYYATTLGIPLANGAYRTGTTAADFWEHSLFVLLTPLLLILPLAAFRFYRDQRAPVISHVSAKPGTSRGQPRGVVG